MQSIRPRFLLSACAMLLPLTVACERPADDADTAVVPADTAALATADAPPPEIAAASERYVAAWRGDDAAAVAAFYTEDATATVGDSTYRGRAEIEERWIRQNVAAVTALEATSTGTQRSGDDWRDEGTYTLTVTPPEGDTMAEAGRYTTVWTRGANGEWQIRSSDVQSNEPPQS
jgi:uncharacterized protein (TIGR02246 family)